jgi:hypothetical protein
VGIADDSRKSLKGSDGNSHQRSRWISRGRACYHNEARDHGERDVLRKLLVLIGKPPATHPVECEKTGPPVGGPFDSVGCCGIDLIGLGLANDDFRAVQREVSEL